MQRIEINLKLPKPFIKIARGLKELKETAYNVSASAGEFLKKLNLIKIEELPYSKQELPTIAKAHFTEIANTPDPWPEITNKTLSSEESIRNIFREIHRKLTNEREKKILDDRLKNYAWITLNLNVLGKFVQRHLPDVPVESITTLLYQPMQRLAKLKGFLNEVKTALQESEQDQQNSELNGSMVEHFNAVNEIVSDFNQAVNLRVPADVMLNSITIFSPKLAEAEYALQILELGELVSTISQNDDLQLHLNYLLNLIMTDTTEQKIANKTDDQIMDSDAMKLCQYTYQMLNKVLEKELGNRDTIFERKLEAVELFKSQCNETDGLTKFLDTLVAIIIAAVVTIVVAAAVTGFCAILGTLFGGPAGTVVGGVTGLIQGAYSGVGIGVAAGSALTGVSTSALLSHFWLFKPDAKIETALVIANTIGDKLDDGHLVSVYNN